MCEFVIFFALCKFSVYQTFIKKQLYTDRLYARKFKSLLKALPMYPISEQLEQFLNYFFSLKQHVPDVLLIRLYFCKIIVVTIPFL